MTKNIIKEAIANVVSNSKVLRGFLSDPEPLGDYASKLLERTSPSYVEEITPYHDDGYHSDRYKDKRECDCSNCMYCLGMSWRDFV